MRIAVADNDISAIEQLSTLLEKTQLVSSFASFQKIEDFFGALSSGARFDAVMMDIDWGIEKTGIDFAKELYHAYPQMQIIFFTGYNDRFSQSIFLVETNLCGYLVKPVKDHFLHAILCKAEKARMEMMNNTLRLELKDGLHIIPCQHISHIESKGHQSWIYTADKELYCYEKLSDLGIRLPEFFFQCHKSFYVNFLQIQYIGKNTIILKNGAELPISKSRYVVTRNAYFYYMSKII